MALQSSERFSFFFCFVFSSLRDYIGTVLVRVQLRAVGHVDCSSTVVLSVLFFQDQGGWLRNTIAWSASSEQPRNKRGTLLPGHASQVRQDG